MTAVTLSAQAQRAGNGANAGAHVYVSAQQGQSVAAGPNNAGGNVYVSAGDQGGGGTDVARGAVVCRYGTPEFVKLYADAPATGAVLSTPLASLTIGGTGGGGAGIYLRPGSTAQVYLDTPAVRLRDETQADRWVFASAVAASLIVGISCSSVLYAQVDKIDNGGTGAPTTIQAQNETGTTSLGGDLYLKSGGGTSYAGSLHLGLGGITALSLADAATVLTATWKGAASATVRTDTLHATGASSCNWAEAVTSVSYTQAQVTTGTTGAAWVMRAQQGKAGSGGGTMTIGGGYGGSASELSGNTIVDLGTPVANATALLDIRDNASSLLSIKRSTAAVTLVTTPQSIQYSATGGSVEFISTTSYIVFAAANSSGTPIYYWRGGSNGIARTDTFAYNGACSISWASTVTSVDYTQADLATVAGTGAVTKIQAQNETGGGASVGGILRLTSGSGVTNGILDFKTGGTTRGFVSGSGVWNIGAAADSTSVHRINGKTQSTVGASGAASNTPAAPNVYINVSVGGTEYAVPAYLAA